MDENCVFLEEFVFTGDKTEKVSFRDSLLRKMSNEYEYETFFPNTSLAWHVEFVSYVIFL